MSKENTATERLSITANVVLLGSYLFMGVCLLAGAILVLTQPLPFAENPMIMKVGMGWVMIPVSLFIICSNIIKIVRRRNAIVIDETAALDKGANIGTTVVTERLDNGMKAEFVLVGSQEANPKAKPMRLSDESPFGKAVMGHHVDEIVTVEAPTMSFEVRILSITR